MPGLAFISMRPAAATLIPIMNPPAVTSTLRMSSMAAVRNRTPCWRYAEYP